MLEFNTWELARPWSYISGYAFVDALRELGHDVELVVLLYHADEAALQRSLSRYLGSGDPFDSAFFWMPHLNYGNQFWQTAKKIAKRRVAVLIESLQYTSEEIQYLPHLAKRRSGVFGCLRYCTHVVTLDYVDFLDLKRAGYSTFWTPGILPPVRTDTFARFEAKLPRVLTAGTIYAGKRRIVHDYLVERGLIDAGERLEHSRTLIMEFESAISLFATDHLDNVPQSTIMQAAERVRIARLALWREYLNHLSRFASVISLPAYFKGLPGRVFEGMLTECAVFIFETADFNRYKKVFVPDKHVHFLSADPTDYDLARIADITRDSFYRRKVATAALDRARETCQASSVVGKLVQWLNSDSHRIQMGYLDRLLRRTFSTERSKTGIRNELSYEVS